jgi:peptidoglycan hydrolase-like protein with peptidoglycan-binding domain
MRAIAAIFALVLGTSVALAQDTKAPYEPVTAVRSKPKAAPKRAARDAKPAAAKPAKAAAAKSEKRKPGKSEKTKPATAKAEATKSTGTKREAAKPETAKPDTAKAETAKAASAKPEAAKPEAAKPDAAKPDATKSESAKSGAKPKGKPEPAAASKSNGLAEAYAALSHAERAALQSNLSWTGDYGGPIDGAFSERLAEAVKAYQKRHKSKISGLLTPAEREALAAAIRPRQEDVGWRLVEDPVTGARVGLPGKLATVAARAPSGTRWSSAQDQLQIETFRIDAGATLEALFEQHKKETTRRRVKFSVMREDHFVVTGMQGLKKFHVRAYARNGEVRGLSILYDQAMEGTIDPMIVAMASAFQPFGRFTVASVTEEARRKVEYGTALAVSEAGHFITARRTVDGCQVIAIAGLGNAERMYEDKDGELALLRVYGAHGLAPIGLADAAAAPAGAEIRLVGVADPQAQAGRGAVSAATAKLGANARMLEAAPPPGFSGAAAVDARGRLLGVVAYRPAVVAGPSSAPQAALVSAERVRHLLAANDVLPAHAHAGLDGVKAAAKRVICVRK